MVPSCKIKDKKYVTYSIARKRGKGKEGKRERSLLLVLHLVMEYAPYSSFSILQVGHLLLYKHKKYSAHSVARKRGEVYLLLLLTSL
jgi:hypothetical protein